MNKPQLFVGKIAASLFCLALLMFAGYAFAGDNTGSGGTITYTDSTGSNAVSTPPYIGGFVVHKFTASGTLTIPSGTNATILVVGGGGGGGAQYGDGGGAGGLIFTTNTLVGGSNYSVTIGAGGAGGANSAGSRGTTGANSVFGTLTALGGGGGGVGFQGNLAGLAGGSGGGGGGGSAPFTGGAGNQPGSASGGFGTAGATGSGSVYGGGGGAGAAATSFSGGNGLQYNIIGVPTYYAGGGAGINGGGTGGLGGGGNPATSGNVGGAGTANTGGGGGGGFGNAGGAGGSGIVIVRYAYDPGLPTVTVSPTNGAGFVGGGSISATATVAAGVPPYSVTYYYKATSSGTYTNVGPAGPFGSTNTFTQTLGTLANGSYNIYATVSDNVSGAATSTTNTFTVYAAGNIASGGTISFTDTNGLNPAAAPYTGGYVVQTFTSSGTFVLPSSTSADVLLVAGGGGAGGTYGSGGGAGGLIYSNLSLGAASYGVTVGAGGGGYTGASINGANAGTNGANSVFSTLTALGGGGGGGGYNTGSSSGLSGGSGGGGHLNAGAGLATQPTNTSGGFGNPGYGFTIDGYGGGGGAGTAATNSNGGIGQQYNISGVTNYYAGGGGGLNNGAAAPGGTGLGGLGGGGNGGASGIAGSAGTANSGGGGGGGFGQPGGNGGSGIVIVRYPYLAFPPLTLTATSPTNGQTFVGGGSISATSLVGGGATPFLVTYYYRLTNNPTYTATAAVGPFGATNTFTQTLGTLSNGVYQIYASVADSVASTTNSTTNIFTIFPPTITLTSPTNGAGFVGGGSISATATVAGGAPSYSVTYYYKATSSGTYINVGSAGPFGATNAFTQTLGVLTNGSYNIYATVADNVTGGATSVTNTFTVYAIGNIASGGTISFTDTNGLNPAAAPYAGGYVVQTFTTNSTLILPFSLSADVLVVAGGGGGGGLYGGGGGAGGLVYSNLSLSGASYGVTVGDGGAGTAANTHGANGTNSVFSTLTALGGGGGGIGYLGPVAPQNGGSGGGGGGVASGNFPGGTATQPGSASGGFGNNGGSGLDSNSFGGGGGAGAAGGTTNGGAGLSYAISGVTNYYAGGGGGILTGTGGLGGGGNSGTGGTGPGSPGAANTGGGGGGGVGASGGKGGSGIVILRYPYSANPPVSVLLATPTPGQNIVAGSSISASAVVAGGSTPFSVTYHYKLTTNANYTATSSVGPFGNTNTFTQTLGVLAEGVYQVYATVADSTAGTAVSPTNTFTVYPIGNTGLGGTVVYTDTNGLNPVAAPPYTNGYVVQTFTANGTLTLPSSVSADVLVVAGGGGGGGKYGCGGGAGGLIYTNLPLSGGTYSATVGAGGNGTASNQQGVNGNNSVLSTLTALGGGGGGTGFNPFGGPVLAGQAGGSGGGAVGGVPSGTGTQPASPSGGYGNNGFTDPSIYGGGGGAGAAATNANGAAGLKYAISGVTNYYAGGGGALSTNNSAGGAGGGGNGGSANTVAGSSGTANTGGGGGGAWNSSGGSGGSGVIIVRYPYAAHPALSVAVTSPTSSQTSIKYSSISATAMACGGTSPYSVTYHYKLTTAGSYTAASAVGPFDGTNTFAQTLGTLPAGVYQVYATVTDGASGTTNSTTNTFTVSLTTGIAVQDANFETPGTNFPALGWATVASVWNPGNASSFQQNSVSQSPNAASEQFTSTCAGGVDWYVLLSSATSISQDLLSTVNVGDTVSVTFYGGRGLGGSSTTNGGVFTASFLVGSSPYSMSVDTTVLTNGTWQSYTLTQVVTNSGDVSLQFSTVSGNPWLDNISVTRTLPSPVLANLAIGAVVGIPVTEQVIGGKHAPTDADTNAVLTVSAVSAPAHGMATTDSTNITYTSDAAYTGSSDSFTYTVSDGFGSSTTATVSVVVSTSSSGFNQLANPVALGGNDYRLSYLGVPSYNYALDWTTNLSAPVVWTPQTTNMADSNGFLIYTNNQTGSPNFWRTRYVLP